MRIVVIEDENRARRGIVSLIQMIEGDYEVIAQAADGRRGFELIRKLKPDLVFTDIQMPLLNGLELIKMVREEQIDTKFVIISAYENFEYARTAVSFGVTEYIVKPVILEDIEAVLKKAEQSFGSKMPVKKQPPSRKNIHPCVQKALGIIEKEYAAKLTQEELAMRLRITPEYFSYLFHRDMGVNFSTYMRNYRIDVAASLLKDNSMKIYDVARITGYNDTKYFCKVFKEVTGLSPSEYMRNVK
ncbi:MAG: response regulator [Clostridiaceae bacterium]|nr:response regulator [Clostridiaceae bacterium]